MSDAAVRGSLPAGIAGTGVGPIRHVVDARWLMAYAAGLGESDPRYFDTLAADGPVAHPMFPVCYEWPVAVALRERTVPAGLQPLGVHATHRLVIHRAPRAGDSLRTSARIVEVAPRRAGTLVVTRFETVDAGGTQVSTTDYGSVYRGVALAGASTETPAKAVGAAAAGAPPGAPNPLVWAPGGAPAAAAPAAVAWEARVDVPVNAALVYTECARIWNPIHTDVAVAQRAGLKGPILHGTATLALAVSRVVRREWDGDAARVGEIRARFTGMVALPSSFTVRGRGRADGGVAFDAVGADGAAILSQGVVIPCDR